MAFNPFGNIYFESPKMLLFRFATMIAAAAWATKAVMTGRLAWVRTALDWPLLALLTSAGVSTALAVNAHISFYGLLNRFDGLLSLACYVALFYLAVNFISTKARLRKLVIAFVTSAGFISLLAVLERLGIYLLPYLRELGRIDPTRSSATYGNPLYLAAFLTLALPSTLTLALYLRVRLDRYADQDETPPASLRRAWWGTSILLVLQAAALVLTAGRAAWLGAAFGVALLLLMHRQGPATFRRHHLVALAVAAAAAAAIYTAVAAGSKVPAAEPIAQRVESIVSPSSGTAFNRIYMWRMTVLGMVRPVVQPGRDSDNRGNLTRIVFGYGLDSYMQVFPRFRPPDWYRAIKENAIPDKPHNDLLYVLVGQGIVGLAAYVVVLAVLLFTILRGAIRPKHLLQRYVLIGLSAACTAYILQVQFSFNVVGVVPLFWIGAGLAVAFAEGSERESRTLVVKWPAEPGMEIALFRPVQGVLVVLVGALVAWGTVGLGKSAASDMYVRAAQKAVEQQSGAEAVALFNDAAAANPSEARFHMLAAQAAEQQYLDTGDAAYAREGIASARRAEKLDPYFMESYFSEASIYRSLAGRNGRPSLRKAEKIYRHILRLDPHNQDAYFNLGITLYDERSFTRAAKTLEVAVKLKPDDPQAYEALGAALVKLRRIEEAKRALRKAVRLDPGSKYAQQQLDQVETGKRDEQRRVP